MITVQTPEGTVIALRRTDRNGLITPIAVPTPDTAESLTPDPPEIPYTTVNLYAQVKGYEHIESENLQIFPNTVTNLNLEFVPLSELPGAWDQTQVYDTPPQNL